MQIMLSDGITSMYSPNVGKGGIVRDPWTVPDAEYATQVEYRTGQVIDSLTFITNKGTRSPR